MIVLSTGFLLAALVQLPTGLPNNEVDSRRGGYCLYVALLASGFEPGTFEDFTRTLGEPGPEGYSMADLDRRARDAGAETIAIQSTLENLQARQEPFACIALLDSAHFVLLNQIEENHVSIVDPPRSYTLPIDTFRQTWSGNCLLIGPTPFASEESINRWRTRVGWARTAAIGLAVVFGLILLFLIARPMLRSLSGRRVAPTLWFLVLL